MLLYLSGHTCPDIAYAVNCCASYIFFPKHSHETSLKCYPDGLIKNAKARFCARGDMLLEGIDFFETYAPVVQWTTVRLMLILEVLLVLKSKQGDVTAAVLHANLGEHETVSVDIPRGFDVKGKNGRNKVLKLNKTL